MIGPRGGRRDHHNHIQRSARWRRSWAVVAAAALLLASACTGDVGQAAGGRPAPDDPTSRPTAAPASAGPTTTSGGSSSTSQPAAGTPSSTPPAPTGRFEDAKCLFDEPDGYSVRCGFLVVPQDRADPKGTKVRLHVGIFHREGATVAADPLVYLEGGPGGNALKGATQDFDRRFGGYAAERDIIVFDQRGTGYSTPLLACAKLDQLVYDQLDDASSNRDQLVAQQKLLPACRDALIANGVDLRRYNSTDSAADVADLRVALGYASWNVYGVSYGTRLAQTLLRTRPEGLRSVILDSTYPTAIDPLVELPGQMKADFDRFFNACRADNACNTRYPDLEARFAALQAALDRQPARVTARDFVTLKSYEVVISGADLADLLFQSLYDPALFTAMPEVIDLAGKGDLRGLTTMASISVTQLPFITLGMHLAVQCHEEVAFSDPAAVHAAIAAHPELVEQFDGQIVDGEGGFETCRLWDSGRAEPEENQPVHAAVPTLVLSGEFDPITPGAWGRQVADALSHAVFVAFPGLGHGVALEPGCPQDVAAAFLANPGAAPDTSCTATMGRPVFVQPKAGSVRISLQPFEDTVGGTKIAGVRPEGWKEAGAGTVARQRNVLDQTALVQQAARNTRSSTLLKAMQQQLPLEGGLTPAGSTNAGGVTWSRYRGRLEGHEVELALADRDGTALLIVLVSPTDERDALTASVLEPALAALRVRS